MASTRIRHTVPILPRVEDLERSDQWTGLASEIGNLERLSSAARLRARRSPVTLEHSSRGRSSYRRSMPEAPKPDLVYVRMTNSEDPRSRIEDDRCANPIQTEVVDRWSWKPRTEFERSYFGMENSPIVDQETTQSTTKDRSPPRGISTNRSAFDRRTKSPPEPYEIGNSSPIFGGISRTGTHCSNIRSADERPRSSDFNFYATDLPEVSKSQRRRTCAGASFDYERPRATIREVSETIETAPEVSGSFFPGPHLGSSRDSEGRDRQYKKPVDAFARRYASNDDDAEYSGSRERLHEIFEHNRLLRRRFFAGMPGTDSDDRVANGADSTISTMRNRTDFQKSSASGFGSTETLTSQSNQSGASSTNGRKSRVEFGNSPEPIEEAGLFANAKIGARHTDGCETSKSADSPQELDRSAFSYTHLPLPSRSVATDRLSSRPEDGERLAYETEDRSRGIFVDRLKESPIDTSADFSTIEDSRSPIDNRRRTDSIDSDHKFFATYVNVQVSSGDSSKASSPTRRKAKPIPPPLDLSTIDQRYGDRYDGERRLLKNYTVEVTPLRDYERPSRGTLTVLRNDGSVNKSVKKSAVSARTDDNPLIRGSKSLLELSANLSKSSGLRATGRTVSTGLSATVNDLRSPKLVNNFSNSMIDLVHSSDQEAGQRSSQRPRMEDEEEEEEAKSRDEAYSSPDSARRKSIGSTTPGTGTTLPLVYGPIPYSQYNIVPFTLFT